ncbi:MAG TPA: hypothetical protein VNH84_16620 [Candidatus Saccharimonadales bacterium]|nr:hypothetical protein [Candidatus Saccharimonadales bacterium]
MNDETPKLPDPAPDSPALVPESLEAPVWAQLRTRRGWRYWARRLLVCNPFFLVSAALLLFGVYRLSVDPGFLEEETQNLLFNFFALQVYEILVALAAVVLARRQVWYDSALLVVLENGLVLVPFMLISQAALIGGTLATVLAVVGGVLAVGRFSAIRRCYPRFNLPWRALWLGGGILALNMALPRIFRSLMEVDVQDWRLPNQISWLAILPLLAAGAHLLPRPGRSGGLHPERPWLPLFNYALWIAGSAVHLWCVQHICELPFALAQLAPLACAAAWTFRNRIQDCVSTVSLRREQFLLALPLAAPLLAVREARLFEVVAALNTIIYLWVAWRGPSRLRMLARHLVLASATLLLARLPLEWGDMLLLRGFRRVHAVGSAATLYFIALAIRSVRPEFGLAASFVLACDAAWLTKPDGWHPALQVGLACLLLHSLRWSRPVLGAARVLRQAATWIWLCDGLPWPGRGEWGPFVFTSACAALLLAGWLVRWWQTREVEAWMLPVASSLALVASPGHWLLRHSPAGLAALMASFVLFALGFATAWNRRRWDT